MISTKLKEFLNNIVIPTFSVVGLLTLLFLMLGELENQQKDVDSNIEKLSQKKVEKVVIDPDEKHCLTKALFFEVRKYHEKEMEYVASTILNRVKNSHYPDTVCDVVFQKNQFEYVMRGLHKKIDYFLNKNVIERKSWNLAEKIATEFLENPEKDTANGAVAFHANTMKKPNSSYWKKLKVSVKSDLHTFYSL